MPFGRGFPQLPGIVLDRDICRAVAAFLMLLTFQQAAARDANAQDAAATSSEPREVIAAVPRRFPPLVESHDDDQPTGFAIDVLDAVARRAGLRVRYKVENDWRGAVRALAEGRAQLVPGVGKTPVRGRNMLFTRPFDTIPVSLFVRSSTRDINGILDLPERKVAVVLGNVGADVLKPYRAISTVSYSTFEDALVGLLSGHADALAYAAPAIMHTAREIGVADRIKVVGAPLAEIKRSIAVGPKNAALQHRLDEALGAFLATPEFKQIFRKWHEPEPAFFSRREVWWTLSGGLLALLIGFAVWRYISVVRLNRALVETSEARSRAETAQRDSEGRFRTAFQNAGVGVMVADVDGIFVEVNKAVCDLLGYSEHDLIGKTTLDITHPDDLEATRTRREENLSGNPARYSVEKRYLRKDGETVWTISSTSTLMNPDGSLQSFLFYLQDITERKAAEDARRESDARFRASFESGGVGMYVMNGDGVFLDVNESFAGFLGYTREDLRGTNILRHLLPDETQSGRQNLRALASGEKPNIVLERHFIHRDGRTLIGIASASTVTGEDGTSRYIIANVQDITARKAAEQALEDSEARNRGVMENIADGIVTIGIDGRIESVNPAVIDMFGYEAEELVGEPVNMLMPEPFAREHDGYLDVYLKTGRAKLVGLGVREMPGLRKDGSVFTLNLAVSEMQLGGNKLFIGAMQDITEQMQAATELVRKTEFLDLVRSIAVAANEASNFEDALKACLDQVCVSLGWPVGHAYVTARDGDGRMLPTAIWHLDDPEQFDPFRKITEATEFAAGDGLPGRILRSRKPDWTSNYKTRKKSPRLKAANEAGLKAAFGVPVLAGSEIVAIIEFFSEQITKRDDALLEVMMQIGTQLGRVFERERAAEETRVNEERLRRIIDLVPHRIFIKDRDGKYLLANRAVANSHGVEPEQLIGKSHRDLHPDDNQWERFSPDDVEVIDSGQPKLIPEETFVDSDERRTVLRTIKVPYKVLPTGETAVLGVSVDITELKDTEDKLRHSQKLEAVGQLTGGLAHDFNNLLTIILGNLQLLVRRLDDEDLKEMAFTAERAGRRGAELTQRLLAFGRRQSLEPKVTDLNRLALGMTDLLRRTLGETVEIETVTSENLNSTLVDSAQVENAILNLGINARDAMPQGGKLTIQTANRRIGRQRAARYEDASPGDYVMLAVTDSGAGMAPDVVERAFDPFFTTKEMGRGSGLGLSMIYGFCRQSGGFATIDSKHGTGTTVSLYLPATDEVEEREEVRSSDAPDEEGSETVLVVEDDPGVRLFAAAVLGSLNYNVLEAEDGNSALELLEANGKVDVLFTDVVLPGGADGRDIANHARKRQPDISVLFTSGFALDGDGDVLEKLDENSLLRKPYTGADLAAKIRMVIEEGDTEIP